MRKLIGATVAALGLAGAMAFSAAGPANAVSLDVAEGTIACSGGPVEGVWVTVIGGTSGWASYNRTADNTADYSYGLGLLPRPYHITVGCGGSTSNWASSNYEPGILLANMHYFIFCNGRGSCSGTGILG